MMRPRLPLLLLIASLAGCFQPPSNDSPAWGLGLDLPSSLPPPGSFPAGYRRLPELETFILDISNRTLTECERPERMEEVRQSLTEGYHRSSLIAGGVCGAKYWRTDPTLDARIEQWKQEGTEPARWEALRAESRAALDRWISALANRTIPGTRLELELMSDLMNEQVDMESWYQNGLRQRADYNESGRGNSLTSSYINFYDPINRSAFNIAILDEFPWSTGCIFQKDALYAAVQRLLERDVALGREVNPDDPLNHIGTQRGNLELVTKPELEHALKHDWPEAVQVIWWSLKFDEHIFENWEQERLPTSEEALYLVAKHRNETRSLYTDTMNRYYRFSVEGAYDDWETKPRYEERAKAILALGPALKPDWSFVSCPNSVVNGA